jgi:hypothetical protein
VNILKYLEMALKGVAEFAREAAGEEQSATVTREAERPPWFQYPPRKLRSNVGFSKPADTQSELVRPEGCEPNDGSVLHFMSPSPSPPAGVVFCGRNSFEKLAV